MEADPYANVKCGKLRLRGEKDKPKKRKHKSSKDGLTRAAKVVKTAFSEDLEAHAGWWEISKFVDIIGPVVIQMTGFAPSRDASDQPKPIPPTYYLSASDDGFINLGPPRKSGEPPAPEEVFTAVKVSDTKVAFKTGYDKYITADTGAENLLTAAADAIGPREQFEPVFQDAKTALLGFNNCFVSVDQATDRAICRAQKAGPTEMLIVSFLFFVGLVFFVSKFIKSMILFYYRFRYDRIRTSPIIRSMIFQKKKGMEPKRPNSFMCKLILF